MQQKNSGVSSVSTGNYDCHSHTQFRGIMLQLSSRFGRVGLRSVVTVSRCSSPRAGP